MKPRSLPLGESQCSILKKENRSTSAARSNGGRLVSPRFTCGRSSRTPWTGCTIESGWAEGGAGNDLCGISALGFIACGAPNDDSDDHESDRSDR